MKLGSTLGPCPSTSTAVHSYSLIDSLLSSSFCSAILSCVPRFTTEATAESYDLTSLKLAVIRNNYQFSLMKIPDELKSRTEVATRMRARVNLGAWNEQHRGFCVVFSLTNTFTKAMLFVLPISLMTKKGGIRLLPSAVCSRGIIWLLLTFQFLVAFPSNALHSVTSSYSYSLPVWSRRHTFLQRAQLFAGIWAMIEWCNCWI